MSEQDLQKRLQTAVDNMINDFSLRRLRPMQKQAYICSAECFDNPTMNEERIQMCLNTCTGNVRNTQNAMQNEMNNFQNKLTRCVQVCQDEANDGLSGANKQNPAIVNSVTANMNVCASNCVDKHISMLKSIQSNIESSLDK
jgi:hypothetical protein